jgi:hypothetical protein
VILLLTQAHAADVVTGASALACAAIGLFFFRFWRQSADRLFLMFALAFWTFGGNRLALALVDDASEAQVYLYVLRLAAFVLIIAAIVDKNRRAAP